MNIKLINNLKSVELTFMLNIATQAASTSYCVILLSMTISPQTEQLVIDVIYCEMGSHKKMNKKRKQKQSL